jgi:hypothetical protein
MLSACAVDAVGELIRVSPDCRNGIPACAGMTEELAISCAYFTLVIPAFHPVIPAQAGIPFDLHHFVVQILPFRILFLNQPNLPRAIPLVQLLLSRDGHEHVRMFFEVHQLVDLILPGETVRHV